MAINQEAFYNALTREICGSLDLGVALERALNYLGGVFPVNEMLFCLPADETGAVRVFARALIEPPEHLRDTLRLPPEFWQWFRLQAPFRSVLFNEDTFNLLPPQLVDFFPRHYREAGEIIVHLEIEEELVGLLMVFAPKGVFYTQEHADLMASVAEPFALALAQGLAAKKLASCRHPEPQENAETIGETRRSNLVIGERGGLVRVMGLVDQVAGMNNTVLILGETGVGKEIVANAIHQRSSRWNGPFIKVNSSLSPALCAGE